LSVVVSGSVVDVSREVLVSELVLSEVEVVVEVVSVGGTGEGGATFAQQKAKNKRQDTSNKIK